jgi:predicted secreted acid phosphatase
MKLTIGGSVFTGNHANEGGGAVFFVSNDRTGTMSIRDSTLSDNPNVGFHTPGLPGIYFLGARRPAIVHTILR